MDPVVLDTDVLSFFAKGDTRASLYSATLVAKRLCVSFQTVAELRLWAVVRRWGVNRREALDSLLASFVVLPYDSTMAQHWAEVTAHRRRLGRPIDCGDAWIAASALRHSATLVSHNAIDFADIPGLTLVSRGS
ncbi:MAG TPA: type II toxin-antitoxin system VapC family toxin [Pirellulales bacterium]|jgi:predicted nucleic acid-binding protein|nr:type II toxin-antitoxin system VapC family toxin [Pirellulales bacterium]